MHPKIQSILNIIQHTYNQCSYVFHNYFIHQFKSELISYNTHTSHMYSNKALLEFDERLFKRFVDNGIYYRLGLNPKKPLPADIIYDLSDHIKPEIYTEPLDTILEKIVYSSIPKEIIDEMKTRLEGHDINEVVIEHVICKLM